MTTNQRKPKAVLISDIHFTTATLELASKALIQARDKALELKVPLILAGDTLDGKALIRGECANRLIQILSECVYEKTFVLVGNHDLLSEKAKQHSLNFLAPYCLVIQAPMFMHSLGVWLVPYLADAREVQAVLDKAEKGSTLIMHQGVQTAFMGHYVQDKSSLPKEEFADFRVISGHYHRAQDIKCGRPKKGAVGMFSYIGTPYTTSFSEANDGHKGFQILYDDGLMELIPTNLRQHMVLEWNVEDLPEMSLQSYITPEDLVWLKIKGSFSKLEKLNKKEIGQKFIGHSNFKLDKIYTDKDNVAPSIEKLTGEEIFDRIINSTSESQEHKDFLIKLWRELM